MGYERNDRRYYGSSGEERDRPDQGTYNRGRATSYGYGARDYRGDRFDDRPQQRYAQDQRGDYGDPRDRGFVERAGDEVRSWFGDEEAERRRREDARYDERHRGYGSGPYGSGPYAGAAEYYGLGLYDYGYRVQDERDHARGSNYAAPGRGADRGRHASGEGREAGHDHGYRSWRDREIQALDRDYHDYARENQSRFDSEFGSWRKNRQGQRQLLDQVQEHQEVVGSDGAHVGTVDHVRGDHIRLTKQDSAAGGHHHAIPSSWIHSVDDKVTLTRTADQARQHWRDDDRGGNSPFGREDGRVDLNRSFSGTY
jgi:hypothetical protein